MKSNSIKKGIIVIFFANIINLLLSLTRNFLLPKYLSIEAYADIKTYQLYITFISIFALGYIDGMYLKYGGKDSGKIDKKEFIKNMSTFRTFQLIITLIIVIIGIIAKSYLIIALGFTVVALNSTDYFKSYYQAVGEYKKYSNTLNVSSILMFVITIFMLLVFQEKSSIYYIFSNVIVYYIVWIMLEIRLGKKNNIKEKYLTFSQIEFKKSISSGFVLMIGLLISNFMTGLDRIFIKITLDTSVFAMYSFAASMESFLNYAISPISITLYNYFCKEKEKKKINNLKILIIIFLTFLITAAFPIKFIVNYFINKYNQSINVLFILFAAQLFYATVRCFYINLYKANKMQKKYFRRIITILLVGIISNVVLFVLLHNMEAYAIGTLVTAIIWLIICEYDFNEYKIEIKEKLYIIIILISFIICGLFFNAITGMILYLIINIFLVIIFYKKTILEYINQKKRKE